MVADWRGNPRLLSLVCWERRKLLIGQKMRPALTGEPATHEERRKHALPALATASIGPPTQAPWKPRPRRASSGRSRGCWTCSTTASLRPGARETATSSSSPERGRAVCGRCPRTRALCLIGSGRRSKIWRGRPTDWRVSDGREDRVRAHRYRGVLVGREGPLEGRRRGVGRSDPSSLGLQHASGLEICVPSHSSSSGLRRSGATVRITCV